MTSDRDLAVEALGAADLCPHCCGEEAEGESYREHQRTYAAMSSLADALASGEKLIVDRKDLLAIQQDPDWLSVATAISQILGKENKK